MKVKGPLRELPGGDAKACTRVGTSKLEILRSRPANIDTGMLISGYALRHGEAYS